VNWRSIVPAEPAYATDGTPYSDIYEDVYHSASGGLEQARHVFLAGNGLPGAWQGRERFVVLETGFGLGLNFLATWQAWREDPQRCARLHFVAVEKHPFRAEDLGRLHAAWPELAALSSQLVDVWPMPVPGVHQLHLDGDRVTLTLVLGDAAELLPNLAVLADALYLDGFSPARNPEMWSAEIAAVLARLAAPGATLATWSVAEEVMEHLAAAGFALEKRPGFGTKRYMLAGGKPGHRAENPLPGRRVAIIGAGAAGSSAAQRLAARGYAVTVLEQAGAPAQGASGNTAGVFRPLPSLGDNALSRLLRAGFLYGRRHLARLQGVRHGATGVLHVARDEAHQDAQRRVVETQHPPTEFCRFVERDEAAFLAGWPVELGGWWFPTAGWINPPSLCRANLAGLPVRYDCTVDHLARTPAGLWQLLGSEGQTLAEADIVVLANGIDAPRLAPGLPVRVGRGLVSHLPESAVPAFHIVATRNGYVTPAVDGIHCAGATLASGDTDPAPRLDDHRENLLRLDAILPGYGAGLAPETLAGRVGFRPMSPDRLPMVGALSASDGLYVINGFGARGLVFASLCGELLAAQIAGEPLPVEADLAQALDPGRFSRPKGRRKNV
jgi:tRNA 5-methylaminomethyl-2-thiouridine biosynthesis bifunctional protein